MRQPAGVGENGAERASVPGRPRLNRRRRLWRLWGFLGWDHTRVQRLPYLSRNLVNSLGESGLKLLIACEDADGCGSPLVGSFGR